MDISISPFLKVSLCPFYNERYWFCLSSSSWSVGGADDHGNTWLCTFFQEVLFFWNAPQYTHFVPYTRAMMRDRVKIKIVNVDTHKNSDAPPLSWLKRPKKNNIINNKKRMIMYKSTHRKRKAKSNSRAFQMASAIVMYSWQGFEHYQETEQHQRKRALPHCNSIRAWNIVTVLGGTAEALCTNIRWVLKYPDGICWTCNSFEIEPTIEWDEQDCHCYLGAVHIVTSSTYMWLNIIEDRPLKGTN